MTKILSTIGPITSKNNLRFILDKSEIVRLNMSHNTFEWHKKIINDIRKIDKKKYILVDIPGAKPRTLNEKPIKINKNQKITFAFNQNIKNIINISNPLPKLSNQKVKTFSISDGAYLFKFISLKKNKLTGISLQEFILHPRKGLNIPNSIYNDNYQSKIYKKFINKINYLKFDCIGLSFVQNSKIIKLLKKKFTNKIFVSKIENHLGYLNRKEIIDASDAVMIDRGDLAAEVGNENLTEYCNNIIEECQKKGRAIIIATDNLSSLTRSLTPSKSDILSLDYFISKKVDYIMLSDETANSKYWRNTLIWLNKLLSFKNIEIDKYNNLDIYQILKKTHNQVLVFFSKKGKFYDRLHELSYSKLILFTQNKKLSKLLNIKNNINAFYAIFPKKNIDSFLYETIKKNKKLIFNKNENAVLVNAYFPRKNSRANSISLITKKDFY